MRNTSSNVERMTNVIVITSVAAAESQMFRQKLTNPVVRTRRKDIIVGISPFPARGLLARLQ